MQEHVSDKGVSYVFQDAQHYKQCCKGGSLSRG